MRSSSWRCIESVREDIDGTSLDNDVDVTTPSRCEERSKEFLRSKRVLDDP